MIRNVEYADRKKLQKTYLDGLRRYKCRGIPIIIDGEECPEKDWERIFEMSEDGGFYIVNADMVAGHIAAAIGAASAMVFLRGGNFEQIAYAVNMMVGDVTGIICDGAKPGCALKIATAVSAAQRAAVLALSLEHTVQPYGIVSSDVEATIQNLGTLGRDGMGNANDVVLRMMLDGQHDENVLRL